MKRARIFQLGVDVLVVEGGTHLFGLTFDEAEAAVHFDCGAITQ